MGSWNRDCVAYQAHAAYYLTHYRKNLPTPALEETWEMSGLEETWETGSKKGGITHGLGFEYTVVLPAHKTLPTEWLNF